MAQHEFEKKLFRDWTEEITASYYSWLDSVCSDQDNKEAIEKDLEQFVEDLVGPNCPFHWSIITGSPQCPDVVETKLVSLQEPLSEGGNVIVDTSETIRNLAKEMITQDLMEILDL